MAAAAVERDTPAWQWISRWVASPRFLDGPAEGEQRLQVIVFRRLRPGTAAHHVVEAQGLAPMGMEAVEDDRLRLIGIDDREHVADPRLAMHIEFGMPQMVMS